MAGGQIINIPRSIMKTTDFNWDIDWRGQTAGEPTSGDAQVVFNRQPKWMGSTSVPMPTEAARWWRSIRASARGRANIYRVPIIDPVGFDDEHSVDRTWWTKGVPFNTGVRWNTGFGFEYRPFVVAVGNFAAGSTQIVVDESPAAVPINEGMIMSHNDYPFFVTERYREGANYRITIEMPLRSPVQDGDLIFQYATGLFQASSDTMGVARYGANRISDVRLQFTEILTRPS